MLGLVLRPQQLRRNALSGRRIRQCNAVAEVDKCLLASFVAAPGASSYTFAWATLSQSLPEWLDCHVRMYDFYQGVSAITIPDNLLAGVSKPDRYEAEISASYRDLAEHYGTCVIPARVRKPRDKGKVEAAVLVAQRWILAVLRHRTFYSLAELNAAIAELLVKLNKREMRQLGRHHRGASHEIQFAGKPINDLLLDIWGAGVS